MTVREPGTALHVHDGPRDRIPVYAIWPEEVGPQLSLGMLTASARNWDDGRLNRTFEIRRPETVESFLDDLAGRTGPALLLCSNYVWTITENLRAARVGVEQNPDLVVVHGGPSTPKYAADAERFLAEHDRTAHVLVRGEGEESLCELLTAFDAGGVRLDPDRLRPIDGITFRDPSGAIVRTGDRARLADLDSLPSPYLTGEFDGLPASAWVYTLSIETNRGCPYGCTFCDWGSATMSRIRKFSLDRVAAELRWAAELGIGTVTITDANFGIISRDIEICEALAAVRQDTGAPAAVTWTAAKNTTKHLVRIMDVLSASGVVVSTSLSLQTTDPATLEVIDRTNIATDHYVSLAADYRRRGYPLVGDLMLGLPGQTYEAYKADLQFMLDHEIMVRTWPTQMLPNSPMNAPDYRQPHQLQTDDDNIVRASATFDAADRRRMWRLRTVDTIAERFGVLRHVMRYLQWDLGIAATDLEDHLLMVVEGTPTRFPRLSWVFSYFDLFPAVARGWRGFYAEVRRLLTEDFDLDPDDTGLATVLALQELLMPAPGRTFPAAVDLPHDYLAYYRSATAGLYTTGRASLPSRSLAEHPPARFTVDGDPMGLCRRGLEPFGDPRSEVIQGDFHVGAEVAYELSSPLLRKLPALSGLDIEVDLGWVDVEPGPDGAPEQDRTSNGSGPGDRRSPVAVSISTAGR